MNRSSHLALQTRFSLLLALCFIMIACSAGETWVSPTIEGDAATAGSGGGWTPMGGSGGGAGSGPIPTAGAGGTVAGAGGTVAGSGAISGFDGSVAGSGGAVADAGDTGPTYDICDDDAGVDNDASAGEPCLKVGDLKVQVRFDGAVNEWIRPWFKIVNIGSTSYPLDGLTLRYYYTVDAGSSAQTMDCWSAQIGCSSFSHEFVIVSGRELADYYLELSFSTGSIPAGGDTGDIQLGFHKSDWSSYDGSNDWSYDAAAIGGFVDAARVPLYLNGTLVWGIEPAAAL